MKKYLIAGLLVWLPLAVTIWVLHAALGLLDGVFAFLLSASQAMLPNSAHLPLESLKQVPGLGVLVMLVGLLITGVFATNIQRMFRVMRTRYFAGRELPELDSSKFRVPPRGQLDLFQ